MFKVFWKSPVKCLTFLLAAMVTCAGAAGAEIRRCPLGGYWYDTETGERATAPRPLSRIVEPTSESGFDYSQWEAKPILWYE